MNEKQTLTLRKRRRLLKKHLQVYSVAGMFFSAFMKYWLHRPGSRGRPGPGGVQGQCLWWGLGQSQWRLGGSSPGKFFVFWLRDAIGKHNRGSNPSNSSYIVMQLIFEMIVDYKLVQVLQELLEQGTNQLKTPPLHSVERAGQVSN